MAFNPRLTNLLYCNTSITKRGGVVTTPSLDFRNRTPYELGINRKVLISIHTYQNEYNRPTCYVVMTAYDVIKHCGTCKLRFFVKNIGENSKISKFCYKILYIGISQGFLLIQKENDNSNMFCKFNLHSMQIFFKMAT